MVFAGIAVNHRVDRGTCAPPFLKQKFLHDFAGNTTLYYTCELLVWLRVMFQSVFEVIKVLYVSKY